MTQMWGNVSAQCWGVILPCHIPPWSNGRLKHQVEGDGRCELVSCGRGLDAVFYEKVRQLFLGVVVQLETGKPKKCKISDLQPRQKQRFFNMTHFVSINTDLGDDALHLSLLLCCALLIRHQLLKVGCNTQKNQTVVFLLFFVTSHQHPSLPPAPIASPTTVLNVNIVIIKSMSECVCAQLTLCIKRSTTSEV